MSERIAAPSGAQLKRWEKLTMEKYRRREGLFLAEGGKVVGELLRSGRPAEAILVSEDRAERGREILADVPAGMPIFRLTDREWTTLSQDPSPEGVMAVAAIPPPVDPAGRLATVPGASLPRSRCPCRATAGAPPGARCGRAAPAGSAS